MIHGHRSVREQLEASLPPVTLLHGPASVGKRTLALHLLKHHGCHSVDQMVLCDKPLSVDESRRLREFVSRAPMGKFKAVVLRLDGASDAALNALLKVLEEPPRTVCFILLTEARPLDTIASRAMTFRLGLLSSEDLRAVLTQRLGMEDSRAERAARIAGGQVGLAMEVGDQDASRAYVLSALKAIADQDSELLDAALQKWDESSHELLVSWATEAYTGRWRRFTAAETFGLAQTEAPLRLLRALSLGARPRLAARAVLEQLVATA